MVKTRKQFFNFTILQFYNFWSIYIICRGRGIEWLCNLENDKMRDVFTTNCDNFC